MVPPRLQPLAVGLAAYILAVGNDVHRLIADRLYAGGYWIRKLDYLPGATGEHSNG